MILKTSAIQMTETKTQGRRINKFYYFELLTKTGDKSLALNGDISCTSAIEVKTGKHSRPTSGNNETRITVSQLQKKLKLISKHGFQKYLSKYHRSCFEACTSF